MEMYYSKKWNDFSIPEVTIITTVYNRREILLRAMKSVERQTFRDIEYVVVNNGSTINIDDIVLKFIDNTSIPVLYIKRDNGIGPHTGKNTAIKAARGHYLVMLDSDDELLPNAVEVLYNEWMNLPESDRGEYREVVALCEDENGNQLGDTFPDKLNHCSRKEASKIWHRGNLSVEHISMCVTQQLKDYPFPEPEGVTWVVDSVVLWDRLAVKYRSRFINDSLKRYYTQSTDSISNTQINVVTLQHCINMLWAYKFTLNHINEYAYGIWGRIKRTLLYCKYYNILKIKKSIPKYEWTKEPIKGFLNNLLISVLWLPSIYLALNTVKNKM